MRRYIIFFARAGNYSVNIATMALVTDARVVRTRASLDRAVTELAAQLPISAVTVSELAEAAGINRVTFYKHFDSPSEALASTLERDLRRAATENGDAAEGAHNGHNAAEIVLKNGSSNDDPIDVFKQALHVALDHIERFTTVYQTQLAGNFDGVIHPVLTEYFAQVIRSTAGAEAPTDEADSRRAIAVSFIAHGIAGVITGWLEGICVDREKLIAIVLNRLPDDLYQNRS